MKLISLEQEEEVVRLYRSEKYTIKQICEMTGVASEQTIYRILRERNIPKRKIRRITKKISVSLDHEAELILDKVYDALTGDNKKKQSKKYKKSSSSKSSYRRKDTNYRDAPAWFHDHNQNL